MFAAPNTLTQRMEGPSCKGVIRMDVSKMRDGDVAGFSAFQGNAAMVSVRQFGRQRYIVATTDSVTLDGKDKMIKSVDTRVLESVSVWAQNVIYLRIDADFNVGKDVAIFYYSLDGKQWTPVYLLSR